MRRRADTEERRVALAEERKCERNRLLRPKRVKRGTFLQQKRRHAARQRGFDAVVDAKRRLEAGETSVLRVDNVLVETSREETNEAVIRVRRGYMLVEFYDGQHDYMNPVNRGTDLVQRSRFAFQKDRLVFYVRRAVTAP